MGAVGTQTSALGYGGYQNPSPAHTTSTEEFDGSTWAAQAALSTAKTAMASAGVNSSGALGIGGAVSPFAATATTEEWTKATTVRSVDTT